MPDTPILEAEAVLTMAIRDALAPFVGTFNTRPKAYYQLAEQGAPLPYVVFQFQSDIGRMDWLGETGATAQLTLKAFAVSAKAAHALVAAAAPGLDAITALEYTITARSLRTPILPQTAGAVQAGLIYRIRMEATP